MTAGRTEVSDIATGGAAAHVTVFTRSVPSAELAAALDCDESEIIDRARLAEECERLAQSRAEGIEIVLQNITGEIALVHDARMRVDARIEELSRRADALEAAIAEMDRGRGAQSVGIDVSGVRAAMVGYESARQDPDGPSVEALALADEYDAAAALRDHARRTSESPMLAAAEAELEDARASLRQLRESIGAIDAELIATVNRAHTELERAEATLQRAKRSARQQARAAVERAADSERAALAACGFATYATFAVQIAQGGNRPEDDAALAAAQRRVSEAEALRRRAEALASLPGDDALDEDDADRRARAIELLGREPGDDVVAELRAARVPGARLDVALGELADALRAIGVEPDPDPRRVAQEVLDAPPVERLDTDVEALETELDAVDDEGLRLSDEYDRLGTRLDELSIQRANLAELPPLHVGSLEADDAETIVRDLLDSGSGLTVINEAFDDLSPPARAAALAACGAVAIEIVIVSTVVEISRWAERLGAEVLDALPPLAAPVEVTAGEPRGFESQTKPAPFAEEDRPPEAAVLPPSPPPPPPPPLLPPPPSLPHAPAVARGAPVEPARIAQDEVVAIAAAGRAIEERRRARADRIARRNSRRIEREERLTRKLAERIDSYAGAIYYQPSEVAPWAHWEAAAEARRHERQDRGEPAGELARRNAHATADAVEARLSAPVVRGDMQVCVYHRNTETRVRCTRCAEPFCDQCLVPVGVKQDLICVECAVKAAGVRERRRRA